MSDSQVRPSGVVAGVSLSIQIVHDASGVRLVPIGEIDVHSATTFTIAGELAVDDQPAHLHIDLSQVTFLDSSGVRGIEAVMASAAAAGVPSTVIGRDVQLDSDTGVARPMMIWSGDTTRLIAVPKR